MTIAIAIDTSATIAARQFATNCTIEQLDNDSSLQRIELGEVEGFEFAAEGYAPQDGDAFELTAWIAIEGDPEDGFAFSVVAVRTADREDVRVDIDIEREVEQALETERDEDLIACAGDYAGALAC